MVNTREDFAQELEEANEGECEYDIHELDDEGLVEYALAVVQFEDGCNIPISENENDDSE